MTIHFYVNTMRPIYRALMELPLIQTSKGVQPASVVEAKNSDCKLWLPSWTWHGVYDWVVTTYSHYF